MLRRQLGHQGEGLLLQQRNSREQEAQGQRAHVGQQAQAVQLFVVLQQQALQRAALSGLMLHAAASAAPACCHLLAQQRARTRTWMTDLSAREQVAPTASPKPSMLKLGSAPVAMAMPAQQQRE